MKQFWSEYLAAFPPFFEYVRETAPMFLMLATILAGGIGVVLLVGWVVETLFF